RNVVAGALAAQVQAAGVALPYSADAGWRSPSGRRADGGFRTYGHHHGYGQGIDPEPASGAARGSSQGAGGLAVDLGGAQQADSKLPALSAPRRRWLGLPGVEHLERLDGQS